MECICGNKIRFRYWIFGTGLCMKCNNKLERKGKTKVYDSKYLQLEMYQIENDDDFRRVTKHFINHYEEVKEQMRIGYEKWDNLFDKVISKKEKWNLALAYQKNM